MVSAGKTPFSVCWRRGICVAAVLLGFVLSSGASFAAAPAATKLAAMTKPAAQIKLAARPARTSLQAADAFAPISFALVRGTADACGAGCDSWIAAEGTIDLGAAARFRKFMEQIGESKLPIYFNSPGGILEQALAIGTLLRERKAVVRVGRTTLRECGFETQDGETCTRLKQSGRELHGEVWTRGAMCDSACPFLILGAPIREIAPDATLAVHAPRVFRNYTGGLPTDEVRGQALQQDMARLDRMVLDYISELGADPRLWTVSRSVPFEGMRNLTREEIARFALDRRERIESPWMFEVVDRGVASKTILVRKEGEASFRATRLRLVCFNQDRFELDVERNAPSGAGSASLALVSREVRLNFLSPPRRSDSGETWGALLDFGQARALAASAAELMEGPSTVARADDATIPVDGDGLQNALKLLVDTCPPPKTAPQPVVSPVPWQQIPWPQAFAAQPVR
ncbi:hypothetical protein SSBR45G_59140 [Bradyrhizobium sp. SSBR45G]|nr:hypothetical protein SSBR45G_59140 [Bradyrhizobium sp. SSBR45G]GLH88300.1 hypothetical protein SSBR45R_57610 [Bradyrhizobium sp. SSBR45R]